MCIGLCIDMHADMCIGMCIGMHGWITIIGRCDARIIQMCVDVCIDMCIDMCTGIHTYTKMCLHTRLLG